MPKGSHQKLKLYYLNRIMREKTDDEHGLSMKEIQNLLSEYDCSADRKSLYDDFDALKVMGLDIIGEKAGNSYEYHVGKKEFDIAELKLLVDAVQSSKFITAKKSDDLIKKLTAMASDYEADQLKRQVVVHGRVKNMNESIYYVVDDIHHAISSNSQIMFDYMQWNLKKQLEPKKREPYRASPWALIWAEENYYLVAYDEKEDKIKHYRVDKMKNITVLKEKRLGKEKFKQESLASYANINFGMFGGEEKDVKIEFKNEIVGVIIDRFGKNIMIHPSEKAGWSHTTVKVAISRHFFGWIFALGTNVSITGPVDVVIEFEKDIDDRKKLIKQRKG
ncbi:MAG: WYL domain-containing protein [Lachnospiraceae bacterium]|nr:WYL domain-containing protein [Lachnospiraceae bacterium]